MFKINKFYIFFTLFFAFFVLALFESARGSFIPFFVSEFNVSNVSISSMISFSLIGNVIGYYIAGIFNERYEQKATLIVGIILCGLVATSALFVDSLMMLSIFYFVFNVGRSFLCLAVDSTIPMVAIGFEVLLINITHLMYGLGSFAAQKAYGTLLFEGISWRNIYLTLGIVFLVVLIFAFFIKVPSNRTIENKTKYNRKDLYKNPLFIILVVGFVFGSSAESMMFVWFINYMSSTFDFSALDASHYSSAYFIAFSAGRLIGGAILQKMGATKGLKTFMLLGSICVFAGILLKENGLILLTVSGVFISVFFPSMMIVIASVFKMCPSLAISTIITWGSLINIGITMLVGLSNDMIGVDSTFYFTAICLFGCFLSLHFVQKKVTIHNRL